MNESRFSFGTRADETHLSYNTEIIGNIHENPELLENNQSEQWHDSLINISIGCYCNNSNSNYSIEIF